MADKINITCKIKNLTGNRLTVESQSLDQGDWQNNPMAIDSKKVGSFSAGGKEWFADGTQGQVTYQTYDGTLFVLSFNIPWGASPGDLSTVIKNDGGGGANTVDFIFERTDDTYNKPDPSPYPGGDSVTAYFLIQVLKTPCCN